MKNKIGIKIFCKPGAELPNYASEQAAGADLRALLNGSLILKPGESALIPTGLHVEIPEGYEIQIRPRSGLALKHQITILNSPGTIDSDYRGEIGVIVINHGHTNFTVAPGMRIAQMVVAPVYQAEFIQSEELIETARGINGFGHTGLN